MNTLTDITAILVKHYHAQIVKWWWNELRHKFLTHKIRHTYSVYSASQRIMTQNRYLDQDVPEELQHRVLVACLLHDIARFYQLNETTILSNKDFEHWDIWFNILLKEGIEDYWILFAVKYHNKFVIEGIFEEKNFKRMNKQEKEETLYLIKMVRDSDKLENIEYMIYNQYKDFSKWEWQLMDKEFKDNYISSTCLECIENKQIIDYKYVYTLADQLLARAAWEFDINFQWTKKLIQNSKFKEFILEKLEKMNILEKQMQIMKENIY